MIIVIHRFLYYTHTVVPIDTAWSLCAIVTMMLMVYGHACFGHMLIVYYRSQCETAVA